MVPDTYMDDPNMMTAQVLSVQATLGG